MCIRDSGSTNENVADVIRTTQLTNARTVNASHNFELPQNYYLWNPTCHDNEALNYLEEYISLNSPTLSLFYVWGHSWEFRDTLRKENISKFCNEIGNRADIWYTGAGDFALPITPSKQGEGTIVRSWYIFASPLKQGRGLWCTDNTYLKFF